VGQLVNDNPGFKITVTEWSSGAPEIHSASTILAIGRRHEVGIVKTASVLRIGNHGVVLRTATAKIVLLEITSDLVETISVGSTIRVNDDLDESGD
jgi:hypothetical protein